MCIRDSYYTVDNIEESFEFDAYSYITKRKVPDR